MKIRSIYLGTMAALLIAFSSHAIAQSETQTTKTENFYNGGPIMAGTVNVYYLWYGHWEGDSALELLPSLAQNLGGSRYWNFISAYYDNTGAYAANSMLLQGQVHIEYPYGHSLTDTNLRELIASTIKKGGLPLDSNGVYVVLTSADVSETSIRGLPFCSGTATSFNSYHSHFDLNGTALKYVFVGDPSQQPCKAQLTHYTSPNNNPGADAMASSLAHELAESITDPLVDDNPAWVMGEDELADMCDVNKGVSRGLVTLGSTTYFLQPMTENLGTQPGSCVFSTAISQTPIYRFSSVNGHFYTLNFAEGQSDALHYDGIGFKVFSDDDIRKTEPLFRCFWTATGFQFVSVSPDCEGWVSQGIYGYLFTTQVPGSIPLYRFNMPPASDHLTTTDYQEGITNHYQLEGILGYVPAH